jgi:hypothetical protein
MVVFAWCLNNDNRPSRSAILDRCSAQQQEEGGLGGSPEFRNICGGWTMIKIHHSAIAIRLEGERKGKKFKHRVCRKP